VTRVVVGEFLKGEKNPKIIGIGESETKGMRHGYVVNFLDTVNSIKNAVSMAEKISGIKIKRAHVSINSITLRGDISSGMAIVSQASGEIVSLDINKALEDSENNLELGNNRKIIQMFPLSFKLDGKEVLGQPEGMRGTKLEAKSLFVTCSSQHLEDLISTIAEAGIETIDIIASSLAGSNIALTKKQKTVGSALVNIGSETVSLAVFENGFPISLHSFPIGSADITNDIALGFKIPLEKAESFKLGNITADYPRKKLNEIIEARLSDIFDLIENHLKKIKRNELLPAGIVFIGGGANTPSLEKLSKSILKLPSKIGTSDIFSNTKTKLRDPAWFTALGLIISDKSDEGYTRGSFISISRDLKNIIRSLIKQLLP
jgi:cell division protein FtsA